MRRLAAAGMLPERAGQPVKVWVHIPLAELLAMDGSTTLVREWAGRCGPRGPGIAPRPPRAAEISGVAEG